MRILITDLMYPNKYSRWRNEEIKTFIIEHETDILVFKCDAYAGIKFDFDFDYINKDGLLNDYNILIFNPLYNEINKYNKNIDGTIQNNKFPGSYLLTKNINFNINNYDLIYHIFIMNYNAFNNLYKFNIDKQIIHLYPGGGINKLDDIAHLNKNVNVISTHPLVTNKLNEIKHTKKLDVLMGTMNQKDFNPKLKQLNNNKLVICFSSMGSINKGSDTYVNIATEYKSKYPEHNIDFISIGNCVKSEKIKAFEPMGYMELSDFYYNNVDIYLNLDNGNEFNGQPLGNEAVLSGSVLLTTDPLNNKQYYNIPNKSIIILEDVINDTIKSIYEFYNDRDSLQLHSINCQKFIHENTCYINQQEKIINYFKILAGVPT